jgi:hypothetical protein
MSMLERKSWTRRNKQLPERYKDLLPQPLPPLRLAQPIAPPDILPPAPVDRSSECVNPSLSAQVGSRLPVCRNLTTLRNVFGLSRRYYTKEMTSYDPEDQVSLQDMLNIPDHTDPSNSPSQSFYPYPNRTAFRLGNWFWNGGVQKSQASFHELMKVYLTGNLLSGWTSNVHCASFKSSL